MHSRGAAGLSRPEGRVRELATVSRLPAPEARARDSWLEKASDALARVLLTLWMLHGRRMLGV